MFTLLTGAQALFLGNLQAESNREGNKILDRMMEYARVVGVELADMLAPINSKVEDLVPQVPAQYMLGGDRL